VKVGPHSAGIVTNFHILRERRANRDLLLHGDGLHLPWWGLSAIEV